MSHPKMLCAEPVPKTFQDVLDQGSLQHWREGGCLHVEAPLVLTGDNALHLPDDLVVHGNMYVRRTSLTRLPERLAVLGNLTLDDVPVSVLPESIWVAGDLSLRETCITTLPTGFEVSGSLIIDSPLFTYLPEGLCVWRDLIIPNTSVQRFPQDMYVGTGIVAPTCLVDLQRFLATEPETTHLSKQMTQHQRMHLRPFPDLLRVLMAMDDTCRMGILRRSDGTYHIDMNMYEK